MRVAMVTGISLIGAGTLRRASSWMGSAGFRRFVSHNLKKKIKKEEVGWFGYCFTHTDTEAY
jgi:hypothetical protein